MFEMWLMAQVIGVVLAACKAFAVVGGAALALRLVLRDLMK